MATEEDFCVECGGYVSCHPLCSRYKAERKARKQGGEG